MCSSDLVAKSFRASNNGVLTAQLLDIAREITGCVVSEIRTLWPDGKCVHIEEIQDLVEKNLMKSGHHDVARRYIIYREERAKARRATRLKATTDSTYEWVNNTSYVTHSGEEKSIDIEETRFVIDTCCQGLEDVSSEKIVSESVKNYFHGIQIGRAHV